MRNRRRKEIESKKRRKRTILFTLGILIFIYLSLTLIFGENGFLMYVKLKAVSADMKAEIRGIERQNKEMGRQIDDLKNDPNLIEELARKQGLTREDEIVFKFEAEDKP